MMRRVLITGAYLPNKGSEAMLRTVQQALLPQVEDAIGLLPMRADVHIGEDDLKGLIPCHLPDRLTRAFVKLTGRSGILRQAALRRRSFHFLPGGQALNVDSVVDISGYRIGDPWYKRPTPKGGLGTRVRAAISKPALLDLPGLLEALRAPVFYLPQAWGPFEIPQVRSVAEKVLRNASKVYARDVASYEWLRELATFSEEKVAFGSDIAFQFEGASPEVGRSLLSESGVVFDASPLVGIVPNMRVYERSPNEGLDNPYITCLVKLVDYLGQEGHQVILMPHEIRPEQTNSKMRDDRYLCRVIAARTSNGGRVYTAVGNYSAAQLKSMIGHVDLLVASRFHSIVAALSLRCPVVAIAWAHKYAELLGTVGLGDFAVSHQALEPDALVEICKSAWGRRDHSRMLLEKHVPDHEASSANVLSEVASMINEA